MRQGVVLQSPGIGKKPLRQGITKAWQAVAFLGSFGVWVGLFVFVYQVGVERKK